MGGLVGVFAKLVRHFLVNCLDLVIRHGKSIRPEFSKENSAPLFDLAFSQLCIHNNKSPLLCNFLGQMNLSTQSFIVCNFELAGPDHQRIGCASRYSANDSFFKR